jgi:hypothetical protein
MMLERLAGKLETLLDTLNAIAANELQRRKAWPLPVDMYGPRGTEIRFPDDSGTKPYTAPYDITWSGGGGGVRPW